MTRSRCPSPRESEYPQGSCCDPSGARSSWPPQVSSSWRTRCSCAEGPSSRPAGGSRLFPLLFEATVRDDEPLGGLLDHDRVRGPICHVEAVVVQKLPGPSGTDPEGSGRT